MANENNNFDKLTENSDITEMSEQETNEANGGVWYKPWTWGKKTDSGAGATMNAEAPQPTVVENPGTVTEEVPAESAVTALVPQADTPKTKNLAGNRRRR